MYKIYIVPSDADFDYQLDKENYEKIIECSDNVMEGTFQSLLETLIWGLNREYYSDQSWYFLVNDETKTVLNS